MLAPLSHTALLPLWHSLRDHIDRLLLSPGTPNTMQCWHQGCSTTSTIGIFLVTFPKQLCRKALKSFDGGSFFETKNRKKRKSSVEETSERQARAVSPFQFCCKEVQSGRAKYFKTLIYFQKIILFYCLRWPSTGKGTRAQENMVCWQLLGMVLIMTQLLLSWLLIKAQLFTWLW